MSIDKTAASNVKQEATDVYAVFCEACGYSLAGLVGDRCPECGAGFDPNELPFARIAWLHRRRVGKINGYIRTAMMVCFRPASFARELCRPVRISARDARSFRLTTIWVVTAAFAISLAAMVVAMTFTFGSRFMELTSGNIAIATLGVLGATAALHLFLRLATDMPLFIWKGIPSLAPTELAPIHHYACAPLVMLPLPMLGVTYLFYYVIAASPASQPLLEQVSIACALVAGIWLWGVALILMQVSTRPGPRRLMLMAVYLPLHWVMMFAMSSMLLAVAFLLARFVFRLVVYR